MALRPSLSAMRLSCRPSAAERSEILPEWLHSYFFKSFSARRFKGTDMSTCVHCRGKPLETNLTIQGKNGFPALAGQPPLTTRWPASIFRFGLSMYSLLLPHIVFFACGPYYIFSRVFDQLRMHCRRQPLETSLLICKWIRV